LAGPRQDRMSVWAHWVSDRAPTAEQVRANLAPDVLRWASLAEAYGGERMGTSSASVPSSKCSRLAAARGDDAGTWPAPHTMFSHRLTTGIRKDPKGSRKNTGDPTWACTIFLGKARGASGGGVFF